jgi:hypothetical protein
MSQQRPPHERLLSSASPRPTVIPAARIARIAAPAPAPVLHHPPVREELRFENPMRAGDALRFRLALDGPVRLELVSISGREGWIVIDASLRPGWHSVALPEAVPPGTYFTRLRTRAGRESAMMVVAR